MSRQALNKLFFMQKVVAWSQVFLYALAMSNTTTQHAFGVFNGQSAIILEVMNTTAWVAFDDGDEQEVSMFELELL